MKKVEMVRCFVTSPNPANSNPEGSQKSVRYIPSEIFRLWHYLMVDVKGFQITNENVGIWVDSEMYHRDKGEFTDHKAHPVVEISFTYAKDTFVGRPVIRYFPKEYFETIMQYFLRNFSQEYIQNDVIKIEGFYIDPTVE